MTVFYIDTTSNYLYTAIVENNKLLVEKKECLAHDLSTFALNEVAKMFLDVNKNVRDIDKIIVVNGPGSFTGIRIGVTIAKIISWCLNIPITVISSLEAMSLSIDTNKLVVPVINARRNAVYGAIYSDKECVLDEGYLKLEKLLLILNGLNKEYVFVSNDTFNDIECVKYDPDILKIVKKFQNREAINAHLVNPNYLKLTEAEENRLKEE